MDINKKIKELRLSCGYTLDKLAQLTGLTKGYLSKIERSTKAPPFSTLETIAGALNQNITHFLKKPRRKIDSRNIDIVTISKQFKMIKSNAGYSYKSLVNDYNNKYMSPFFISIKKGDTKFFKHDGEEFIYVIKGRMQLFYENKIYYLNEGDSFYLDSRIKHRFRNDGVRDVSLLAVNYTYRRF